MSRIHTMGASLAVLAISLDSANAADIPPYYAPPPAGNYYTPPPVFSWSGPYLGVFGGYGWGGSTISHDGWIGGAFAGANYQMGSSLVVGVEGDISATGKSGTSGTTTVSNPWNATLRGRLGFAMNRALIYGTGGLAVGNVDVDDTVVPTSESSTLLGWTAGAGVDVAFTDHLFGRVEYRYTSLGSDVFAPATINVTSSDLTAGLGFKF